MDIKHRTLILDILARHRIMSLATLRADGWPQATVVGYASEGLTLYFLCAPDSQKVKNLAADPRVSLTINGDGDALLSIAGLSMAARAEIVTDIAEVKSRVGDRMCLMGNVNPLEVGVRGTPEEVREATLAVLEKGGDRGMILSVGGGTSPGMPRQNILAMQAALAEFNQAHFGVS